MMLGIHSCREVMHAMWRPQKFKAIYLLATLYVLTLTLPSAASVYWAFGDQLLTHSNALALLPRTAFRDAAVVLMLVHQFITFGFACTPLYFVWEKLIGLHDCRSLCKRAAARLPVVVPIWFLAIVFPFFGPINSAVGSLLVSFTVYIIPALAHMITFRSASAREVYYYTLLLALFFTILLAVYLHAANNIICFLFYLACFL
jgi:auxin influx carrier (AUX1 LAX family)